MKNQNKLVSIIIPAYNIEKYISTCLKSIINQTYKNIEIVIVNDGSTDNTEKLIDQYIKKDKRIKKINQNNSGPLAARNLGLKKCNGELILFVDSDDYLHDTNCIEELVNNMGNSDIIMFPYIKDYNSYLVKKELFDKNRTFNEKQIKDDLLLHLFGQTNDISNLNNLSPVWGKMYKKEIIDNNETMKIKYKGPGEDLLFNIEAFYKSKQISYINNVSYHYERGNDNSITRKYNKNLLNDWENLYNLMNNFIIKNKLSKKYNKALDNRKILEIFSILLNITNSDLSYKNKRIEMKKSLNNDLYKEAFKNFDFNNLKLKWKLFYKNCYKENTLILYIMLKLSNKLKRFF